MKIQYTAGTNCESLFGPEGHIIIIIIIVYYAKKQHIKTRNTLHIYSKNTIKCEKIKAHRQPYVHTSEGWHTHMHMHTHSHNIQADIMTKHTRDSANQLQ